MTASITMTMKELIARDESIYKNHNKQETNSLKYRSKSAINYTRYNNKNSKQKYTPLRHDRKLRW